jgi:hypothetical protein
MQIALHPHAPALKNFKKNETFDDNCIIIERINWNKIRKMIIIFIGLLLNLKKN